MKKAIIISLESPHLVYSNQLPPWIMKRMLTFPSSSFLIASCISFWGRNEIMSAKLFCLDEAVRRESYRSGFSEPDRLIEKLLTEEMKAEYDLACIVAPCTMMANRARFAADLIKKISPKTCVITGGPHASFTAEQMIQAPDSPFDAVIMGPGESKIKHIVCNFNRPEQRFNHPGICSRNNCRGFSPEALHNDCEIPELDFSLLSYKELGYSYAGVLAGRGCPNRCRYCIDGSYWSKAQIPYFNSALRVRKEIQKFNEISIPVRGLLDSQFDMNSPHFHGFCETALGNLPKINNFSICAHAHSITRAGCQIFRSCGGGCVMVGIESASADLLKKMGTGKPPLDHIKNTLAMIKEEGLKTLGFFLFGYPGENKKSAADTLNLIKELCQEGLLDLVEPFVFAPYPGLPHYEKPQKFGIHPRPTKWNNWDNWDRYSPPPYDLENMSSELIYDFWQQSVNYVEDFFKHHNPLFTTESKHKV